MEKVLTSPDSKKVCDEAVTDRFAEAAFGSVEKCASERGQPIIVSLDLLDVGGIAATSAFVDVKVTDFFNVVRQQRIELVFDAKSKTWKVDSREPLVSPEEPKSSKDGKAASGQDEGDTTTTPDATTGTSTTTTSTLSWRTRSPQRPIDAAQNCPLERSARAPLRIAWAPARRVAPGSSGTERRTDQPRGAGRPARARQRARPASLGPRHPPRRADASATATSSRSTSIDLEIAHGEFFTLLGPSGSGKTTTLRMIAGFEEPDAGTVELGGRDVSRLPPYDREVNTVFQDYALFPHMTVAENIEYGLRVAGVAKDERARRRDEALEMVRLPGLRRPQARRALRRPAPAGRAGAGDRQPPAGAAARRAARRARPEAARADAGRAKAIQEEVGITFVYVTHDQEEALTMSNRIAVFNEGRIEQVGTPAEVYERPRTSSSPASSASRTCSSATAGGSRSGPRRSRMLENGETHRRAAHRAGRIRDVAYAGMITRYIVDLDAGGELQVVRQNLETSSAEAQEQRGRKVKVGWRPEHTVAVIEQGRERGEPVEMIGIRNAARAARLGGRWRCFVLVLFRRLR